MLTTLLLSACAAQGGTPILTDSLHGFKPSQGLGGVTLDMRDLNGDGIHDLAISSPGFDFPDLLTYSTGRVEVPSGADGSLLFHRDARADFDFGIGSHLVNMGDVDGDGINDLFVGADGPNLGDVTGDGVQDLVFGFWSESFTDPHTGELHFQDGFVRGFDGRSGRMLFAFHGNQDYSGVGHTVSGLGDLDGDGTPDFASLDSGFGLGNFTLRVHSGLDGSALYRIRDPRVDTLASLSVDSLDDFTKDGTPDILLAVRSREDAQGHAKSTLLFLDGANGTVVHQVAAGDYPYPGRVATTVGDLNGDGFRDVAVGEPLTVLGKDRLGVRLISGRDASILSVIDTGRNFWYGHSLAGRSDSDGDGRDELMVGMPYAPAPDQKWQHNYGAVQFWALR